jgi:Rrf2 family protein
MKLTRASSYALHAVTYMAQQKSDKPVASHIIAKERGIPERFLLKVLKPLVSARVLISIKGPNGGYKLARPASDITVLEIVEGAEMAPISGQVPRPEVDKDKFPNLSVETLMPLYRKLDNICKKSADLVRDHLGKVKLTELVKK